MSGGFFRGTSAEQDTRFSNKQAKLLKTQKFPPELEHVVDIAKVKMDVVKPWIAKRVTELLGFEDEVLINFINGLLEGKDINGKQIQIQLTGFMEKHTGKFMKELWSLLLSAQNNASGVPQQFLDAKEEETRKKKEELDRIGNEMQKRKEKDAEHVNSRMGGGVNDYSTAGPNSKLPAKESDVHSDDEKEADTKNGFRRRSRYSRSPGPANKHPSPYRERNRSRNLSRSPLSRRNSVSPERRHRSPQRSASDESLSPRRRSPFKRRSTSKRSVSPAPHKVRSPVYRRRQSRSPQRSLSRSPRRRRSPSPWRRRSPSPVRRRSPYRRRRPSPSPRRGRSPPPWSRRRSRSPRRVRSPSPWRKRRSISPRRRLSPSPVRRDRRRSPSSSPRPVRQRPSSPPGNGSRSRRRSPSPLMSRNSLSPLKRGSPSQSPSRARSLSPISGSPSPVKPRVPVSTNLRSSNPRHRSPSPQSKASLSPVQRSSSSSSGGDLTTLKKDLRQPPTDRSREEKTNKSKLSQRSVSSPRKENVATHQNSFGERHNDDIKSRKKEKDLRREKMLTKEAAIPLRSSTDGISSSLEKPAALSPIDEQKEDEELVKLLKKDNMSSPTIDSIGSEGSGKNRAIVTKKRKHRKSSRREIESESSSEGSEIEDRKEAKRRRKEEKRMRKDEKRRRREERRKHKEKRAHKRRSKDSDTMSSDSDKHENDVNASTGKLIAGKTYSPDNAEMELEKKKIENELREKAIQNIRAKKGISR